MAQVMRGHRLGRVLSVGVTGAGTSDALSRLLGGPVVELEEPPDVVVERAAAAIATDGLMRIGDAAAFDDDRFVALGRAGKALVELGEPLKLRFDGAVPPTSLLVRLLDLAALRKRLVPLPGAVLSFGPRGVALLGWPHSGKTSAVLGLAAAGGTLVADDRAYAGTDPPHVVGLHTPLEIRSHHVDAVAELGTRLRSRERARLTGSAVAARAMSAIANRGLSRPVARHVARVASALGTMTAVTVDPERVAPTSSDVARIDAAFVLVRHDGEGTTVSPLSRAAARQRFAALVQHDLTPARALALQYAFALPERSADVRHDLARLGSQELGRFADDVPFHIVHHSSRDPHSLVGALLPLCT